MPIYLVVQYSKGVVMTELRKADTLYDIDFDTLQKISGTETDTTGKPIFYDIPTIKRVSAI